MSDLTPRQTQILRLIQHCITDKWNHVLSNSANRSSCEYGDECESNDPGLTPSRDVRNSAKNGDGEHH